MQQLSSSIDFPEQLTYEVLRPVVLFGYSPGERAEETGVAQRTLYRQAACFAQDGMEMEKPRFSLTRKDEELLGLVGKTGHKP